jgi:hypothetical protein
MDFKDILWMPIDLPVFDKKDELVKEFKTDFTADAKSYDVRGQLFLEHSNNYEISKVKEGLTYSQTDLIEYCKTNLPFTDLVNIKIHHITTSGMKMHIDFGDPEKNPELYKHIQEHEPCGFRMLIKGTKSGDMAVMSNDEVVIPTMATDTDWYAINYTEALHGSSPDATDIDDRYVLFCMGWIDKEKHKELINRSIDKYSDYIVKK